jgi:hypothetical protein
MTEPMTLATDYALAGVCGMLGLMLLKRHARQRSRLLWALAFLALGLTALLGGTYHGFHDAIGDSRAALLWKSTVLSAGLVSFAMLCGSAYATASGAPGKALIALAAAKLVLYEGWMLGHDAFIWVIADTGSALAAVAMLHAWSVRQRAGASRWMLAGVAVSVLAALVQAGGVALHPGFNHNDLYHVMQIAAMAFFYRGVRSLRDRNSGSDPELADPESAHRRHTS